MLYEASESYGNMLMAQNRSLESGAELLNAGVRISTSDRTRARLEEMAESYLVTHEALESALRASRQRRHA